MLGTRAHCAARSPSLKEPRWTWRPFFRLPGADPRDCQMWASHLPVLLYLRPQQQITYAPEQPWRTG